MALDHALPRPIATGVTAPDAPLGFWAAYRTARRNVLELIPEAAYREPVLGGGRRPGWLMLMDPPALETVLKTREDSYPKSAILKRLMRPRRGDNLITAEGAAWKAQRRRVAPAFAPRAMAAAVGAVSAAAGAATARLDRRQNEVVDVFPEMVDITCDVICRLILSGRESIDRAELAACVNAYVATIGRVSFWDLAGVPNWVPRPGELVGDPRARMDTMADRAIAARLAAGPGEPPDLLDLLIEGAGPDPDRARRIEIRNNLTGFLFAGHETTALALAWALYLLALDPAAQTRARDEAWAVLGDRPPSAEDTGRLIFCGQVIDEALRLYPPAGFLTRTAMAQDTLCGRPVAPGTNVILPVYALHRHALLWEEPQTFAPERFAQEAVAARHRFAYLPFGAGPRICIGAQLALMEARLVLAALLCRFRFDLPSGTAPQPQMWFTLRPAGGVPLRITRT